MNRHKVRVAITGEQVSPERVSLKELVGILTRLDRAIVTYAQARGIDVPEDAATSLVGISSGSENLELSVPDPLLPAVAGISQAIEANDFSDFPKQTYAELYELSESVVRRGWGLAFHAAPSLEVREARITPEEPLKPPPGPTFIDGTTVIHGRCLRVGGAVVPKAEVRVSSTSKLLNVDLSEEAAKELAKQLYEEVALEGTATWNADTWEIVDFRVSRVTPFRKVEPEAAFRELAVAAAGRWDEVDPVAYVEGLRKDE